MSQYDTVKRGRSDGIVIKNSSDWLVINERVKISLKPHGEPNQITGVTNHSCNWFLWENDHLTAKVHRAAENDDETTVEIQKDV